MDENKIVYSTQEEENDQEQEEFSTLGLWQCEDGTWEIKPWLLDCEYED